MKKKGFTLIEILIIVAIVGILAAIAIPMYKEQVFRARVASAVDVIKFCKEVDNPASIKVVGKPVVVDVKGNLSPAYNMLKERAMALDKQLTVFVVSEGKKELVGSYSVSKEQAYREYLDICVVYLPEKSPGGKFSVLVYDPPKMRRVGLKIGEYDPSRIVANFVEGVSKGSIPSIDASVKKDEFEELIPVSK